MWALITLALTGSLISHNRFKAVNAYISLQHWKIKCAKFETQAESEPFFTGRTTEPEPATDAMHSSFTPNPTLHPDPPPLATPPPCHLEVQRTFQPRLLPDFLTTHPDWLSHRDYSVWICLWLTITQSTLTPLSWPWSAQRWISRSPRVRKVWNPSYLLWSNFHMLFSAFFVSSCSAALSTISVLWTQEPSALPDASPSVA